MKNKLLLILSIIISFNATAQERQIAKANEDYEKYAYIDAISIYEKVAEKGYTDAEMLKKLGNSYYFNADLENAGKWYGQLFELTSDVEPEYYFRYSQCLKSQKNYTLANEYLEKFANANKGDARAKLFIENKDYLGDINKISNRYSIEDAGINTEYSDYGGNFYKDQFVFTTTRDTGGVAKIKHTWTNQAFSNLYAATVSSEGFLVNPEPFSKEINSKFHESSAVFTKDGNTVYFTRNNYLNGKKRTNEADVILLKLYKAEKVNGKWTNISELPFNSNEYNTAHPALSPDDKTLYFASDMPGTRGLSDIFKVAINEDGTYGTPENLGDQINTEGRETFPFVSQNNEFYLASDGHLGLGGLDVFVFKIKEDGTYSTILNVGAPVNSPSDDFSYIIDDATRVGFFTSNREGGKGYDDIYKFKEEVPLPFNCNQTVTGTVVDEETNDMIPNAMVRLFDENMNQVNETFADENGVYNFEDLDCDTKYFVRVDSKDFETIETPIHTEAKPGKLIVDTVLPKKIKKVTTGDDLAKTFNIKIIYFDLDKSNIRKDAAKDLAKIVEVMKENPTMKIDVRSHTDSRQTNEYNQKLSDLRAKSTIAWMVKNGIDASRLTGRGYGESQLVNKCADGVECSEEEHQANRRSEFIITVL